MNLFMPRAITKKLTDEYPSIKTKITMVSVIVSSNVIIISVR